jgi:hypothetical protein
MSHHPKLIGTYTPPSARKGERVTCLYRDCECVVTGFHDGRIPWPRVRVRGARGGAGLWINDDLKRAILTESAKALMYWFGVGCNAVCNWRRAFEVKGKFGTVGSKRANHAAAFAGGKAMKEKDWTDEEPDAKAETAKRYGTKPGARWTPATGGWTTKEVTLLGTDQDEVIAERIGRTVEAVRCKRSLLKIPTFRDRRCRVQ